MTFPTLYYQDEFAGSKYIIKNVYTNNSEGIQLYIGGLLLVDGIDWMHIQNTAIANYIDVNKIEAYGVMGVAPNNDS